MTALVTKLGALGVFALMVPESACIPIPSEVTLMCAGFGVRQGWISIWAAISAATAGNLLGSLIAYWLGRAGAQGGRLGGAASGLARCEGLFERFGARAVFFARLLPLARTFVSLPAGYARIDVAPFVAMTIAGCALWATAFVLAGLLAGAAWGQLSGTIGEAALALAATVAAALLVREQRRR